MAVSFFGVKFNVAYSMILWIKSPTFFLINFFLLNYYKWFKKVAKNIHEYNFFFSYFPNSQIWLNWLMDGCHLGHTTKLKKKLTGLWHYNWESFLKIYNNCLPNIKKLLSIICTGNLACSGEGRSLKGGSLRLSTAMCSAQSELFFCLLLKSNGCNVQLAAYPRR